MLEAVDIQLAYSNVRIGRYVYVMLHEAVTGLVALLWVGIKEQIRSFVVAGILPFGLGLAGLIWAKYRPTI